MKMSENINELATALSKFQSEVKDAERSKSSYNGKYAALEQIYAIIRPLLSKHGLAFKQDLVSQSVQDVKVQTWIIHASGQYMMSELTVPVPPAGCKSNPLQEIGKSSSYARRYAIMGAVGMTQKDEDDDADSLSASAQFKQAPVAPPKKEPFINYQQIEELKKLLEATGSEIDKFCQHFKVNKLGELTISQFNRAKSILGKKLDTQEANNE